MRILVVLLGLFSVCRAQGGSEQDAKDWSEAYNAQAQKVWFDNVEASWNYNTNLTDHNQAESVSNLPHIVITLLKCWAIPVSHAFVQYCNSFEIYLKLIDLNVTSKQRQFGNFEIWRWRDNHTMASTTKNSFHCLMLEGILMCSNSFLLFNLLCTHRNGYILKIL